MKKQNHEVNVQASSPSEMRGQIKQKYMQINASQTLISNLSSLIRKKRAEMKHFSDEMTRMLEKKLIPKHTSLYPHPTFNPQYSNPRNQALHSQRQSIYLEITKLKQEISELLSQEQPAIVNQIHKKQAMFQQLIKEEQEKVKQKQMLQETLEENKIILEDYKQSQCLKEIQENQTQLEQIKRQIKQLERRVQDIMHEEISISIYESSVNKHIQQMQAPVEQVEEVDYELVDKMIEEIRKILDDRKINDREQAAKKQQIAKKIKQISEENRKLQKEIREITNERLKKQLERKKKQSMSRNKSLPQIVFSEKQLKKRSKEKLTQKLKNYDAPSLLLTQPDEPKVKRLKKQEQKHKQQELSTIFIGNWRPENHIKDDIIETRNIARAISMKIRTKDKKITGMGVTYIDKIGVEVLGRSNIWKLTEDKLEEGEEEFLIDLQDVVGLYYYSQSAKSSETAASSVIGLKFMSKSSRPVIKVGQFLNQEEVEFLNLENRFIKTIEFTLDNSYKSISGIKLAIFDVKETHKSVVFEANNNEQDSVGDLQPAGLKQEKKNDEMMPSKWQSTTSQAGLTQKKVFVKSPIYSKKLHDIPQVDHRLMLNRKKKMV